MKGFIAIALLVALTGGPVWAQELSTQPEESQPDTAGPLISNVFYDTDIREALRDVASQAGIPIIIDETVHGYISLEINDLPLEECLRRILAPGGYTFRKFKDYYLVGLASPDNPTFHLLSETKVFHLNYVSADDIKSLVSSFYDNYLKIDKNTNTVAITASPEIIERFEEDLKKIDVPPKQIMIEALITEFTKEASRDLGINLQAAGTYTGDWPFTLYSILSHVIDTNLALSFSKQDIRYKEFRFNLEGLVHSLVQSGKIKIKANPRVATLDGHTAEIYIGKEQYYTIVTGPVTYPYTRLEVIKTGMILKITPHVSEDNEITVDIQPEVSDVSGRGVSNLPVVSRRNVTTTVRVRDGKTIIIGGLLQKNRRESYNKIPILGDLPIIGAFFRNTYHVEDQSEVVIFITPHIVGDQEGSREE